jgi:antitoxin component of MazEF toxin-antitoxin module
MRDLSSLQLENVKENGVDMVSIKLGNESLMLTIAQTYQLAEIIENYAGMPASLDHINDVFDNWGNDGGTC